MPKIIPRTGEWFRPQDCGAPVTELDGDELGYLLARVAEIKRRR